MLFCDGFDWPFGDEIARQTSVGLPPPWYDANPFGNWYKLDEGIFAYHPGGDFNMPKNADAHAPLYAMANGEVIFAGPWPSGSWGNLIIIRHTWPDGSRVYSRYAHVEKVIVRAGQTVRRGEQICSVGDANGRWSHHLHADISPTEVLFTNPGHWTGTNKKAMLANYVPPVEYIQNHRPKRDGELPMAEKLVVTSSNVLYLVANPARPFLVKGGEVMGFEREVIGEQTWRRVQMTDTDDDGWLLESDRNGIYLASADPGQLVEVAVLKLNIRRGPGTNNSIVRAALKGEVFRVAGSFPGAGAREWARITEGPMAGNYLAWIDSVGTVCLVPKA